MGTQDYGDGLFVSQHAGTVSALGGHHQFCGASWGCGNLLFLMDSVDLAGQASGLGNRSFFLLLCVVGEQNKDTGLMYAQGIEQR